MVRLTAPIFISIEEDLFSLQKYRSLFYVFNFNFRVIMYFQKYSFFHRDFQIPEVVFFSIENLKTTLYVYFYRALHSTSLNTIMSYVAQKTVGAGLFRNCKTNTFRESGLSADIGSS